MASPRYSHRTRRDRLSINVIPVQSRDAEPQTPYLHWLFGESSEADVHSRLVEDNPDDVEDGTGYSKADAVIMKETYLPTTSQLLARLKDPDSSSPRGPDGAPAFDALVQAIALQLLASCYTILPASSASHLPLFQQQTSRKLVTALRAHTSYRLAPAAGHQARAPSETSPWPGLYAGPEPEETLAETVSKRRRSVKHSSEYVPSLAASGWADGTNETSRRRPRRPPCSSLEVGIFERLTCQPSTPRNPHRKHNAIFSRILFCSKRKGKCSAPDGPPRTKSDQRIATQAVQRIPSIMRLRHTQSNPRARQALTPEQPTSDRSPKGVRSSSSDPSIGSRLRYDFDIPDIRRVSATPNASHRANSSFSSGGPSPFSAPLFEAEYGYFNMANAALLQDDEGREQDADGKEPRFLAVTHDDLGFDRHDDLGFDRHGDLGFDTNGQTAADRKNDTNFGTETGHNSQERPAPARADGAVWDDDYGPGEHGGGVYAVSDPRCRRNMAKQHDCSDDSSSDSSLGPGGQGIQGLVRRARRRRSVKYPAGEFDSELAKKFGVAVQDGETEGQGATGMEGGG
ncbi:uncharacterized protein M421DRAFT_397865 [Didymella exigua CBS 183.55]|uniref:Uncharacterized protein n=1 Tax=Didymella exigua CBS 183.55 TaxID=1150837 RepID=A0A6A5REC6_9PLEO|nr:uncharacterized protein M421DRAFT_397865 [Didymella exigua CBS 183.55]KAF1925769.1 hypothetical protein M421DRAFT_397865 [Didymella exigua CBS 183.55]